MFVQALVFIVLIVLAAAFFIWMLKNCLTKVCPICRENNGTDEMPLPVLPGYLWWCLTCSNTIKQSDLLTRRSDEDQ